VCDAGNRRVSVFALHGFVLRGFWQPPAAAYQNRNPQLTHPWEPFALACDRLGRVYVTDGANGCVHRFSRAGEWEKCFAGFGAAAWIAIDCAGRVYVVVDGAPPKAVRLRWPPATQPPPRLILDDVINPSNPHHHDPVRLAGAIVHALEAETGLRRRTTARTTGRTA
jgi:hypothetical protein